MRDIPGEEGIFGSASGHENGMGIDLTGGVIFMPGHQSLSERLELRRIGRYLRQRTIGIGSNHKK